MAHLIYYIKEKEIFKTTFEKMMTEAEARIVFDKLCKHFKIWKVGLYWTSGKRHPHATWGFLLSITLNRDWNSFGVLCHELAHIKAYKKYGESVGHSKKHFRIMKGMIAYCEKKNYFEEELKRRLAPKSIRPELTKQEEQQIKIRKAEAKIKRYEMKIKMYQKKLCKTNRSLSILKKRCFSSLN